MFLPVPKCLNNLTAVSNKYEGKLSFLNLNLHKLI
jgi:hypothetical protein